MSKAERSPHLDRVRARRLIYARLTVPLAFLALTGRLWFVQIVEGPQFRQKADQNVLRVDVIEPSRGIIFDRYDQQLVENAPSWEVSVIPAELKPPQRSAVLARLAALTHADLGRFELALREDRASPALPLTLLRGVPRDVAMVLMQDADALPGVHIEPLPMRHYVDSEAFASILGYMGRIGGDQLAAAKASGTPYSADALVGQAGVEQRYEPELRGRPGHRTVAVDSGGRVVQTLGEEPALPGDSIELTLDAGVQRAAYRALREAMQRSGATGGAGVALDPRDGAVVALVSVPSFDANLFAGGISAEDWLRLTADPSYPLLNHAIAAQFPPGPVIEPFVVAAAAEERLVRTDTRYACPPVLSQHGWNFYNALPGLGGEVTVAEALARHCDTLIDAIGGGAHLPGLDLAGLGQAPLDTWLRRFGFAQRTGIDLPAEAPGFLPDPDWKGRTQGGTWTAVDTYLVAAGAGPTAVTPVQVAVSLAALVNGGTVWQPALLQRHIAPDGTVLRQLQAHPRGHLELDPAAVRAVRQGLALAVAGGSSAAVRVPGLEIGGIGGSAAPATATPGEPGLNAWWAGFGPLDAPQLVVCTLVTGGSDPEAAMPVARAMLDAAFRPTGGE